MLRMLPHEELPLVGPSATSPKRRGTNSTVDELRESLLALGLEQHGKKETLLKRYNNAVRKSASPAPSTESVIRKRRTQPFNAFLCFDVEATCMGVKDLEWPNEIIEFPVVLLRWKQPEEESQNESQFANLSTFPNNLYIANTFHSYVRPTWQPKLSTFCTTLTGITQNMVDTAPTFPEVILKFKKWMEEEGLINEDDEVIEKYCWCTDGPWDLRDFVPKQLHITPLKPPIHRHRYPPYLLQPYINVKEAVHHILSEDWYNRQELLARRLRRQTELIPKEKSTAPGSRMTTGEKYGRKSPGFYLTIEGQLRSLGLGAFKGRAHSGIDDATNIARIVIELARRGVLLEPNARLPPPAGAKRFTWMGEKPGDVIWEGNADRKSVV